MPIRLFVDTGARQTVLLRAAPDAGITVPNAALKGVVAAGVGGQVEGSIARARALRLGGVELTNIITQFQDEAIPEGDGILGMKVLRRFVVTFDYAHSRMMLRPGRGFEAPFEFNMAGLGMRTLEGGGLKVYGMIEGSPATDAGVNVGDVILAINGMRIEELGDESVRELFERDGGQIVVTVQREGGPEEILITLRRLI